jgi:hypothetical protein
VGRPTGSKADLVALKERRGKEQRALIVGATRRFGASVLLKGDRDERVNRGIST